MRQIVCLAQSKWSSDPERTQHLMRLLGDVEIFYFELTVTRDLRKAFFSHGNSEIREPHHGISIFRAPPVYYREEGKSALEKRSLARMGKYIRRCLEERRVRNGLLWCATPLVAPIVEKIPHKGLIYDCHRAWEQYPESVESDLAYEADLVFAASENLLEHISPCNRNGFLLANGVNYHLYARGRAGDGEIDPAIAALKEPVIGYLGDVERSLRLGPLLHVARQHPDWSFVIIGRIRAGHPDLATLKKCKNIHCIGRRSPADVPACLAGCDVCIDLLHNDITDEDVVPERIYAYFAAEKPVACVYPIRYVPEYPDVIYGAQNAEEFDNACLRAANELGQRKRLRRGEYARQADWENRARLLSQVLRENGML